MEPRCGIVATAQDGDEESRMGMTCTLRSVPSSELGVLANDSARLRRVLFGDDEDWTVTKPGGVLGFLLQFTPISIETSTPKRPLTDAEWQQLREVECDLEGTWHGLHFLFTGTVWEGEEPGCYLIRGGEEIGDDDFDVPPRVLRPERVRDFSGFLGGLSEDDLRGRYDRPRMLALNIDVPRISRGTEASSDQGLELLIESFRELRTFIEGAAAADECVIIHLG